LKIDEFVKKTVAWALIGFAIASAISFLVLNDHWARLGPRQPNAATGQIYAQVAGFAPKTTVYLTSQELAEFYFLLAMSAVPALIGGALGLHWKVFAKAPIRFRPISPD
jgi:hypothetical protein